MDENNAFDGQYILITPAKNEEKNLPSLINSIVKQTIKPVLWVIIDDGSADDTHEIIKEAKEKYDLIQNIRLAEHARDVHKHYAYVCKSGFDSAIKFCEEHNIEYEYIGIVDADMTLEPDFFSKLIEEFEKNPKLGIASGSEYYYDNNKLVLEVVGNEMPIGCMRLWKKECFEETGGYCISYSPDSVSNVIAIVMGWELELFKHVKAIQARKTRSAEGLWKGYKIIGVSDYFRNYHPLFVAVKGLKYLFIRPYYLGIAYWFGYVSSFLQRAEKIDNEMVKRYYYNTKYQEVKQYFIKFTNKLICR